MLSCMTTYVDIVSYISLRPEKFDDIASFVRGHFGEETEAGRVRDGMLAHATEDPALLRYHFAMRSPRLAMGFRDVGLRMTSRAKVPLLRKPIDTALRNCSLPDRKSLGGVNK